MTAHQTTRYRAANDPADIIGSRRSDLLRGYVLLGGKTYAEAERDFDEALRTGRLVEMSANAR